MIEGARAGNSNAMNRLISQLQGEIFRMVFYRTFSQTDAEDLTQEILLKMARNLSKLRDTQRFKPWLYSLTLNRVRDFQRKGKIRKLFGLEIESLEEIHLGKDNDDGNPERETLRKEFWLKLHHALQSLSRWEREIFVLRYMDHLRIREIAQALNKSESTVKTNLQRALKKFRNKKEVLDLLEGERG